MIKNIIFDVGGVFFDDSLKNIEKLLHKDCKNIYKKAYGGNFKKCLLGEISVQNHIDSLKQEKENSDIEYILKKENLYLSYPLIKENYEYIKKLKDKGYKLYLLTNITEDSLEYIWDEIKCKEIFTGGIYSYQEHLIKPDKKIYNLLINRFHLKKEETIFFDDKLNNIIAARKCGIQSFIFHNLNNLKEVIEKIEKEKMIKIIFNDKEKKALAFDKDNLIGYCDFIEKENVWNIVHTEVDKNYQGQGIAKQLVLEVISNARNQKKKVIADCSYAKKVLEKESKSKTESKKEIESVFNKK